MTLLTISSPLPQPDFKLLTTRPDQETLWAYNGSFPQEAQVQEMASQLIEDASRTLLCHDFAALWQQPHGAPWGMYRETSERVARVSAVVVKDGSTNDEFRITGMAVAQGLLSLGWRCGPDGNFLVVQVHAPRCHAKGSAQGEMCEVQLSVRCLHQYEGQLDSLLEDAAYLERSHGIEFEYLGNWNESLPLLQRRLTQRGVHAWLAAQKIAA